MSHELQSEEDLFKEWKRAHPNISIDLEDNPIQAWREHMKAEAEIKAHQAELSERTRQMIDFVDSKPDMTPDEIKIRAREIIGPDIKRWMGTHQDPDSVPEFEQITNAFGRIPKKPLGT